MMIGYKATDKDMKCRGYQFELGKWHEHDGELVECKSGFHFCEQPSGPWAYYDAPGTRIFRVEAEGVLEVERQPGADFKRVCSRIRLIKEITPDGDRNTGDRNTGHRNTGDRNTGDRNTGDSNTGHSNTGHRNTGHRNTGHSNTGHRNTGDRNTGDSNTGDWNTGHRNTGDSNTGDWNTGDRNTGHGNATNRSTGFFCMEEPKVLCFDVQTDLTCEQFREQFPEWYQLCEELHGIYEIDFTKYSRLPGITPEKLKALHQKHLAAKKQD